MNASQCAEWIEKNLPPASPSVVAIGVYLVYREAILQGATVSEETIPELYESVALRQSQMQDQIGGLVEAWKEQMESVREGTPNIERLLELSTQKTRFLLARMDQDVAMWRS